MCDRPELKTDYCQVTEKATLSRLGTTNSGFSAKLNSIVAYVNHNAFAEPGLEGSKKVLGAIIAGVPDLKVTAEDVFVSADCSRVVGRYRYDGTHTGNHLGYPATDKAFAMRSIDIWRVENGRFVEHWDELNTLDVFIQIGAVPSPSLG